MIFLLLFLFFLIFNTSVKAEDCNGNVTERIICYENNINKLKDSGKTLISQISQFDAQIKLTSLKIAQTEEQISLLSGRIDQIEGSLDSLNQAFSERAVETYKMAKVSDPLLLIISSDNLNEAFNRFSYLKKIQDGDRNLLDRLKKANDTYKDQKVDQEDLQNKLAQQKKNLDSQKQQKANLLALTKNDEKKYQTLLTVARAEYAAIQGIIAGRGVETEVGKVSQGQRIASIIQGSSCNSKGTHTHFIVRKADKSTDNPFNYLSGGIDYENCSGSFCGSSDGDSFNPSGAWPWPISPKIKFNQGYGYTWAVQNDPIIRQIYTFHNGIDINSNSNEVRAVKAGTLYQGSYNVGCMLKYVRIDHDDSDLDTLYLHVNY